MHFGDFKGVFAAIFDAIKDIHASRQTFVSSISSSSSSSGGTGLLNEALKRKRQSVLQIHTSNVGSTDAWAPLAEEH